MCETNSNAIQLENFSDVLLGYMECPNLKQVLTDNLPTWMMENILLNKKGISPKPKIKKKQRPKPWNKNSAYWVWIELEDDLKNNTYEASLYQQQNIELWGPQTDTDVQEILSGRSPHRRNLVRGIFVLISIKYS